MRKLIAAAGIVVALSIAGSTTANAEDAAPRSTEIQLACKGELHRLFPSFDGLFAQFDTYYIKTTRAKSQLFIKAENSAGSSTNPLRPRKTDWLKIQNEHTTRKDKLRDGTPVTVHWVSEVVFREKSIEVTDRSYATYDKSGGTMQVVQAPFLPISYRFDVDLDNQTMVGELKFLGVDKGAYSCKQLTDDVDETAEVTPKDKQICDNDHHCSAFRYDDQGRFYDGTALDMSKLQSVAWIMQLLREGQEKYLAVKILLPDKSSSSKAVWVMDNGKGGAEIYTGWPPGTELHRADGPLDRIEDALKHMDEGPEPTAWQNFIYKAKGSLPGDHIQSDEEIEADKAKVEAFKECQKTSSYEACLRKMRDTQN